MSNFLAIAHVTEALKFLLNNPLDSAPVLAEVNAAEATSKHPSIPLSNGDSSHPRVNIFLYRIAPNAALRNADLPNRRVDGSISQRARAAYDLDYLLTFHGDESTLEPQRLLGIVLRVLHSHPVLTPKNISDATHDYLNPSTLGLEIESIKLNVISLSLEELSKLWSIFFQTPYSLSLAVQVSVVFIDGRETSQPALPVARRNLYIRPFQQPVIEKLFSKKPLSNELLADQPIIVGDTLVLKGSQLQGDITRVRLGKLETSNVVATRENITIELGAPSFAVNDLRAGVQGLQVLHRLMMGIPETEHTGNESNIVAFVLRPVVTAAATPISTSINGDTFCNITLNFTPPVGRHQQVVLLLNEFNPPATGLPRAYRFDVNFSLPNLADTFTQTIVAKVTNVAPGTYLVRVLVDGAESMLAPGPDPHDQIYSSPTVVIAP